VVEVDIDDLTMNVRDVAPYQSLHQLPRLSMTRERDRPDHKGLFLRAIEEQAGTMIKQSELQMNMKIVLLPEG
jgi:hypothetical protein